MTNNQTIFKKYIMFKVGESTFATKLSEVKEIIEVGEIVSLPNTPKFNLGVVNLRGRIVNVFDLSLKLQMKSAEKIKHKVIMVFEINNEYYGILVDKVLEVFGFEESCKESVEDKTGHVNYLMKYKDILIFNLNIYKTFEIQELLMEAV